MDYVINYVICYEPLKKCFTTEKTNWCTMTKKKQRKMVLIQMVESLQQPECIAPRLKTLRWMVDILQIVSGSLVLKQESTWWIVTKDLILQPKTAQEYVSENDLGDEKG